MQGPLFLDRDPVWASEAATKEYVDNNIPTIPSDVMLRSQYDTNNNGIVDNSEKLEGYTAIGLPISNATQNALNQKADKGDSYLKSEHISESTGSNDAGKPVITDINGKLSLSFLDLSMFVYQGQYTPTSSQEYPDDFDNTTPGLFWECSRC